MADRPLDYWEMCEREERERLDKSRIKTQEPLVLITALFRRWRGATHEEILDQERTGQLLPFRREKTILLPSGEKEHWLQPGYIHVDTWDGNNEIQDDSTVFLESNIIEVETARPDFLHPTVVVEDRPYLAAVKVQAPLPQDSLADLRAELAKNKEKLAEAEAALASQKAENDRLRARVAELENAAQNDEKDEEIGRLKMHLDEAERVRDGLSSEFAVKTLELDRVRQELQDLKAGRGLKAIDERERKTFLKLLNAALFMDKQKNIEDRNLAGKLAKKTQELFEDSPVAERTVRNKLNEIKSLEE